MIESKYISDILYSIIEGESYTDLLKEQITYLSIRDCKYTDVGVFVHFNSSEEITKFRIANFISFLGFVIIKSPELDSAGAEAVLFFKDGVIDFLEIYCIVGEYPHKDLDEYTLIQDWII